MLRRTPRPRRPRSASAAPGLALPKGRTARALRADKRVAANVWKAWVRRLVFATHRGCQLCHRGDGVHEMHEVVSRARLRGRALAAIFNLWNCSRLCRECHREVTERRIDVVVVDLAAGCLGQLLPQRRLPGLEPPPDRLPDPPAAAEAHVRRLWDAGTMR